MLFTAVGILAITAALSLILSERHILYVITSGSMNPSINENDLVVVNGLVAFDSLRPGDIIVFNSPDGISGVVTHRIVHFSQSPDGLHAVTKGDANRFSIPQVDYPITEKELIGKVAFNIPAGGEIVKVLRPPTAYIVILSLVTALSCTTIMVRGGKGSMKPRS